MDLMWSLGARYCARQNAHAYFLYWGLFLTLAGTAIALYRRRLAGLGPVVLLFFALCTGALGVSVFYGCYRWAPYSMGLGAPDFSGARLTMFTCLNQDTFSTASSWTILVVACCAILGIIAWARSRATNIALRLAAFTGALICLLVAAATAFFLFFAFSWCSSSRLF